MQLVEHPGRAYRHHPTDVRQMGMQVVDGGGGRGHDLVRLGGDSHLDQTRHVHGAGGHRVVRSEADEEACPAERGDEVSGARDRLPAAIDDPVEIEDHEAKGRLAGSVHADG